MNAFILAAPASGSGKTTVALAIMRALGERVRPFKIGPDYIDPLFHEYCLGKPSYNLDYVLCGENVIDSFYSRVEEDSVAVIEGVMGLYDGKGTSGYGSSAHLSQVLDVPVVLVLDGRGISTTIAAIAKGLKEFEIFGKQTKIAGVILNRVSSDSVYRLLKGVLEEAGLEVFGYFPENFELALNSRHLGLVPPGEVESIATILDLAQKALEEHVDLEKLLKKTKVEKKQVEFEAPEVNFGLRVAIARDKAFNFYYRENLEILESLGVELIPFSPLADTHLPKNIDALYLGGGFPEVFFSELEANTALREEIRARLEDGLYCYAECGGFIYLSKRIIYRDHVYSGVGFFDNEIEMTEKLQNFGYCKVESELGSVNAHEFHHTRERVRENTPYPYRIVKKTSRDGGAVKKNVVAGYPHLHFGTEDGRRLLCAFLEKIKRGYPIESD